MSRKPDFSGWATRNNLKCSDGRVITKDAFKDNDGAKVPLVWNHRHDDPLYVLGHAILENRDEGVYTYGYFNDTDEAKHAKDMVEHGDVDSLSIYANKLKQKGSSVLHGAIREVSLVLAGANPGAFIDYVSFSHGDGIEDEAIIYTGEYLEHADEEAKGEDMPEGNQSNNDDEKTVQEVFDTLNEEQKQVVYAIIGQALEDSEGEGTVAHADDLDEDSTVEEVFNSLTDLQKDVVYGIIGQAIEGDEEMKHNLFEGTEEMEENVLSHAATEAIIQDAKRYGSLKDSFLSHAEDYGIDNIEYLFPDARNVTDKPTFIQREMNWVPKVMNGTHHSPFSRIKSIYADITEDDARAKGYIKGNMKKEEVFSLLKRTTTPTTIYKKQKLDRDDVIDIVDFDVIAWIKAEMRMMLDEEIARAILVGDGRLASSDDKINETNIRPIWKDEDLYTIKVAINGSTYATDEDRAKQFIRMSIKSRKDYKGSGNPVLFTTEDVLTDCLLLEDKNGRRIYETVEMLKTAMRVSDIVTVPVMENLTREDGADTLALLGLIVNLSDYNVGADKGGAINMFDDFDIDYNQQKYLIETRCSGALTVPYSAIALELKTVKVSG